MNIASAQERISVKYMPLDVGLEELGYDIFILQLLEFVHVGLLLRAPVICLEMCAIFPGERRRYSPMQSLSRIVIKCYYIILKEKDKHSAIFNSVIPS